MDPGVDTSGSARGAAVTQGGAQGAPVEEPRLKQRLT